MTELRLIEPVPVDDDLCVRLALIEDLGHAARFVVAQRQTCYESGSPILVVKRKIVLPYFGAQPGDGARPAVEMTLAFLARRAALIPGETLLRLVKG
jgi:hypothetical protein